jgi:hypothetical protein
MASHPLEDRVQFRLRDVCLPTPVELLTELWGDHVLEGEIVARSRGDDDGDCVVVKLAGVDRLVVVAAESLLVRQVAIAEERRPSLAVQPPRQGP